MRRNVQNRSRRNRLDPICRFLIASAMLFRVRSYALAELLWSFVDSTYPTHSFGALNKPQRKELAFPHTLAQIRDSNTESNWQIKPTDSTAARSPRRRSRLPASHRPDPCLPRHPYPPKPQKPSSTRASIPSSTLPPTTPHNSSAWLPPSNASSPPSRPLNPS